jgi:hypothetical protein
MTCPIMSRYIEQTVGMGYGNPDVMQVNFIPVDCLREMCQCWVQEYSTGKWIFKKTTGAHCGLTK